MDDWVLLDSRKKPTNLANNRPNIIPQPNRNDENTNSYNSYNAKSFNNNNNNNPTSSTPVGNGFTTNIQKNTSNNKKGSIEDEWVMGESFVDI